MKDLKFILENSSKINEGKYIYYLINKDRIVYIGQSTGIVMNRIYSNTVGDKKWDRIYIEEIDNQCNLDHEENRRILKFKPEYNKGMYNLPKGFINSIFILSPNGDRHLSVCPQELENTKITSQV